ncbi:MAG: tRNA (N6-threonylcarbamoyladenosine(37)-N6)-methyltransferase TrmO [Promethearchaeota archaeon]|nr:MAG: tRNA (N6-threonylcarbamoyladenosine(37)-N6)-methyltransferase TrmO [Candidatus Lokiarchaeota archaeon]
MKELTIKPIGYVENNIKSETLKGTHVGLELSENLHSNKARELIRSNLMINDDYIECLKGIEDFSHIIVLFWTHNTPFKARQIKKVHPGGIKTIPKQGIFATRSPVRPNPICETTVKLIRRQKNILEVEGLDAIDKTPLIDIKPHLPSYDSPIEVKLPQWMYQLIDEFRKLRKKANSDIKEENLPKDIRLHPCIKKSEDV